jgi:hypothetical protein
MFRCEYCGQMSGADALECRRCGAPRPEGNFHFYDCGEEIYSASTCYVNTFFRRGIRVNQITGERQETEYGKPV